MLNRAPRCSSWIQNTSSPADQFAFYQLTALLALAAADLAAARTACLWRLPTDGAQRNARALTHRRLAEAQSAIRGRCDRADDLHVFGTRRRCSVHKRSSSALWTDVNQTPARSHHAAAHRRHATRNAAWWQLADALQRSFDLNAERTAICDLASASSRSSRCRAGRRAHLHCIESGVILLRRRKSRCCCRSRGRWRTPAKPFVTDSSPRSITRHRTATVRIYDTNGATIASLYEQACTDGAQLVIGPLDKYERRRHQSCCRIGRCRCSRSTICRLALQPAPGCSNSGSRSKTKRARSRGASTKTAVPRRDHRVRSRLVGARGRGISRAIRRSWAERWSPSA